MTSDREWIVDDSADLLTVRLTSYTDEYDGALP